MAVDDLTNTGSTYHPFLQSALGHSDFEILQLAGDASARRYYRVVAGNESWVLMVWEPFQDVTNYPFLSVRQHFSNHDVLVPVVIAMSPKEGLVLLEDLGDLTLERKFWENQSQRSAIPLYRQSIDELIKMHYACTFDRNDCTAFKQAFDVEKLLWELNYGREHVLTKFCQLKLTDSENQVLDRVFREICGVLNDEPKFIAHRDYHSRNVMIKHGKTRVIDFQDARLGAIQYDLVSLLRDSYVNMDEAIAMELIEYYLDRRKEVMRQYSLPPLSLDHFMHIYGIQSIQRCFKACGSFTSFFNLRNDVRYLKYMAPTLQTVRRVLEGYPQYREFLEILRDHGLFERKFEPL